MVTYILANNTLLDRVDFLLYDYVVNWQSNRLHKDVVVVAIDDSSLQKIGRWPWSRDVHAELLDRLTAMGARAIGFDVLFAEAQRDGGDADMRFSSAIARNGKTVLAVAPTRPLPNALIEELLPLPELAKAAAGLGHVDIEIDTDGLCRSFYLRAGLGESHWPAFAHEMLEVGGESPSPIRASLDRPPVKFSVGWSRADRYFVPFDPRPDALQVISYASVLAGTIAPEKIAGKYLLVGSTATGLGDMISTPISMNHQRLSGVELNAHILSGLLHGTLSKPLAPDRYLILTMVLTALAMLIMVLTGFSVGILIIFGVIGTVLLLSALLLIEWHVWFAPASTVVPLMIVLPFWGAWSLLQEKRANRSLTVRVQHQALHHFVTDLPNQYVLEKYLRELNDTQPVDGNASVLIIMHFQWPAPDGHTIERFNNDEILRSVAQRLRNSVRLDDLVVHLNGDDFGILVLHLSDRENGLRVADDLCAALIAPLVDNGAPLLLTPRIGLSFWPQESRDGTALLRDAYIAMYHARIEQSPKPFVYSKGIAQQLHARSRLEQALVSAIDQDEFEVYYQPQIVTGSYKICGVEALLRWHNPDLGLVYPGTFIPVAEHTGLIQKIGAWVLRTACKQVQQWIDEGLGPLRLAVNISPLQFSDKNLVNDISAALTESDFAPDQLELEITESTLMQNLEEATSAMRLLKNQGVKLALDDFGTGYSSLSNLQHFPLDRIKIDQSFTREIQQNKGVREITMTIITMAKKLNLDVIAEGVETQSQADFLIRNGCNELQGFLISRPLPAKDIRMLLCEEGSAPARFSSADDIKGRGTQ